MHDYQQMIKHCLTGVASAISLLMLAACSTASHDELHGDERISATTTGVPTEQPEAFNQTLKGYMAELGQYMDDVYRFWDSRSMYDVALERLDAMVEIHDRCLELYPRYLESHSVVAYRTQQEDFGNYLRTSRKLTLALKEAIITKNDTQIWEAFAKLDQNRRDAHSAFGNAW